MSFTNSPILEIAIGLVGVYIAFSLMASWANEQIATFLKLRSNTLFTGIQEMLNDAETHAKLYGHPLISNTASPTGLGQRGIPPPDPVVKPADPNAKEKQPVTDLPKGIRYPQYISASQFATALIDIVTAKTPAGATSPLQALQSAVAGMDEGDLKTSLSSILKTAGNDYNAAVKGIQNWFDDSMDRISGWYKRQAQLILFGLGLVIAIIFNVDSIYVVQRLNCDSKTRDAFVKTLTSNSTDSKEAEQKISSEVFASLPLGWVPQPTAPPSPSPTPSPASSTSPAGGGSSKPASLPTLTPSTSPAGGGSSKPASLPTPTPTPSPSPKYCVGLDRGLEWPGLDLKKWRNKFLGFLITAGALSLGAPFWFDALDKLVRVRNAGNKPDTKATGSGK
jgi:hypothetical protein